MKNVAAYYLLILYSVFLLKPLVPVVSDYVAHNWNEAAHLVMVHQEQGSDHVHQALADAVPVDEEGLPLTAAKWTAVEVLPSQPTVCPVGPEEGRSVHPYTFLCPGLLSDPAQPIAPPPRFL